MRFLGQKGSKWAQNKVFQLLLKINVQDFSDFLRKLWLHKVLKFTLMDF